MSPAHGCGGARAIIEFNNSPSAKKSGEARKQAGKKEGGLGEGIFARLRFPRRRRGWGGSVSAVRRAETLGGNQSAKSSGFCSKWVRISSSKHHQIELAASLGASPLASAGSFARKSKGFLKSISSRPAARRRFTNEICIARRAMSRFFSFAKGERQSEILLNCRCGVSFFNYN